jgi:hypothetical protein
MNVVFSDATPIYGLISPIVFPETIDQLGNPANWERRNTGRGMPWNLPGSIGRLDAKGLLPSADLVDVSQG